MRLCFQEELMTKTNPGHEKCRHRAYAMTCSEFDELWARAGGRCEICAVLWYDTPHGMLHIDHNPLLGDWAVRGLLCSRCNTQLGTPGRLQGAAVDVYLAMPWRTTMPDRLIRHVLSDSERETFSQFSRATAKRDAARTRLQQAILDRRHVMPVAQISALTGLTPASVERLFVVQDEWLTCGGLGRPAERPIVRLERSKVG
jgi:hypothetical protein